MDGPYKRNVASTTGETLGVSTNTKKVPTYRPFLTSSEEDLYTIARRHFILIKTVQIDF